jgi:hypothetical protein
MGEKGGVGFLFIDLSGMESAVTNHLHMKRQQAEWTCFFLPILESPSKRSCFVWPILCCYVSWLVVISVTATFS